MVLITRRKIKDFHRLIKAVRCSVTQSKFIAYCSFSPHQGNFQKSYIQKINYTTHDWMLYGDSEVVSMHLSQYKRFTKFPCYICEWDSIIRDQHWLKKQLPVRKVLAPGEENILHNTLVDQKKIFLPPLNIMLGLIKQFLKALPKGGAYFVPKGGSCFKYFCTKFPFFFRS